MSFDIYEDVCSSGNEPLKLTPKIFVQIEVFWPENERGKQISDNSRFSLIKKKYLDAIQPIGYVNITAGFGTIYSSCPGYWVIFKMNKGLWKLKIANDRKEFCINMKRIPDWDSLNQIFL